MVNNKEKFLGGNKLGARRARGSGTKSHQPVSETTLQSIQSTLSNINDNESQRNIDFLNAIAHSENQYQEEEVIQPVAQTNDLFSIFDNYEEEEKDVAYIEDESDTEEYYDEEIEDEENEYNILEEEPEFEAEPDPEPEPKPVRRRRTKAEIEAEPLQTSQQKPAPVSRPPVKITTPPPPPAPIHDNEHEDMYTQTAMNCFKFIARQILNDISSGGVKSKIFTDEMVKNMCENAAVDEVSEDPLFIAMINECINNGYEHKDYGEITTHVLKCLIDM